MTLHIKRAVAAMSAILMLLTLVPTAALPTIQLPALSDQSVQTTVPSDEAADETPSATTDTTTDADASADAPANNAVTNAVVTDPDIIEQVLTSEDGMVMGEDGTVYTDMDNDGDIEAIQGDAIEDDENFDTSALFEEMANSATVGKDPVVNIEEDNEAGTEYLATNKTASGVDLVTGYQNNAYEPTQTDNEDHPFLPGGAAWIDLSKIKYGAPASPTYPFTKWSANTSFINTSMTGYNDKNQPNEFLFPDVDLIDSSLWSGSYYEKAANTNKVSGTTGYAYNRYDAMQGKWGVTIDKNTQMIEWTVNKTVDTAKTPNLMFSTEQQSTIDGHAGNKLAIAVEIGTPTAWTNGVPTAYEYRWYTISDNNLHPGLDYEASKNYIMEPEVQISKLGASTPIINDMAYIDGELTGCIDMIYWLPFVNNMPIFNVRKVRLYSKGDFAARVNYLYFNNQAAPMLSPMSINADLDVATTSSTEVLANSATTISAARTYNSTGDKNGWKNGAAFTQYNMTLDNNYGGIIDTTSANNGEVNWNYEGTSTEPEDAYVQIIIPVRKWMNAVVDSRRFQMSVNIEFDETTSTKRPVFMLRGNALGYSDNRIGNQYEHSPDVILGVFGGRWYSSGEEKSSPYLLNKSGTAYYTGVPEADFAWNMSVNGQSNWYDLLDSSYIRDHMVQSGDAYGWVYVSELLICMPLNTKAQLGLFSFKNNSDSLNSAGVQNAFDGGTGVQPMITTTNTAGQSVSNQAAAFGPLLPTSTYATVDLIKRTTSSAAQKTGDQTVYGKIYKTTAETKYGWNPCALDANNYVGKIPAKVYLPVFATCTYNNKTFGLIGASNGPMYVNMSTLSAYSSRGTVYNYTGTISWDTVNSGDTNKAMLGAMTNNWMLSSFAGMIKDANSSSISYPAGTDVSSLSAKASTGGYYFTRPDCSWQRSTPDANKYVTGETGLWGPNGGDVVNSSNANVQWIRGTDTHFGGFSAYSVTRTYKDPLTLDSKSGQDGYTGNAPVLRYNFVVGHTQDDSGNAGAEPLEMVFIFEVDGVMTAYYAKPNNTSKTITLTTTRSKFDTNASYAGYLSLETIMGLGTTVKLVSISLASTGYSTFDIHNLEVLRESSTYRWDDGLKIVTPADGGARTVADSVDIISDAFNYKIATGASSESTLESRFFKYGHKGWAIASYDLDTATSGNQYTATLTETQIDKPSYRPSLDHLRIPMDSGKKGKFVFEANRSFPTSMFRYLYVSYSVADDDGIAAADDTDTGISMGIYGATVSESGSTAGYYVATSGGAPTGLKYSGSVNTTNYSSCVNLAVDLTKVTGLATINKIAFFLNNTTTQTTDFYVNYLFLSNVPPTADTEAAVSRPFFQNYYLMDGSGDRYSCRFPTTNNPTGRVLTDADRVNPLIIERGDVFHEGTFYNGTPLSKLYSKNSTTIDPDITGDAALEAVWFYQYDETKLGYGASENRNINDFYQLDTTRKSFNSEYESGTVYYDALWNYNRWLYGWGLQQYMRYDQGEIKGKLMELYATTNNVLLRTGLKPIKYQTVYDSQGGQMVYPGSADINTNTSGLIENENNYYITQTVVLSYYTWPHEMHKPNTVVNPVKYGYTFAGWYETPNGQDGTRIYRYDTKQEPGRNVLYAHWTKDSAYNSTMNTVTFQDINGKTWFTREASRTLNDFVVTIPTVTRITDKNGSKVPLVGWTIGSDTSKVYTPGMKLTVTKSVTLVPYTDTNSDVTVTITVSNAKLYLYKNDDAPTQIKNGDMGIKVSGNTYSNIPRYTVLVAKPTVTASTSKSWQATYTAGTAYSASNKSTQVYAEVSTATNYTFAANTDITLNYTTKKGTYASTDAVIWTAPQAYKKDRQMMFYTQFELPKNATFVACGTLYTKNTQVGNLPGWGDTDSEKATALHHAMVFEGGLIENTHSTGVRYTPATKVNDTNQYYWMVTENKGNAVTYYARGYVGYNLNGLFYIAYSDIISTASVPAAS